MDNAKLKRAISVHELTSKKYKTLPLEGEWKDLIGIPQRSGVWFIKGGTANGKTRFILKLCKMLTKFGRVAYDTLEEGDRMSFQRAVIEENMKPVASKFQIWNREHLDHIRIRLRKQKSPQFIVIDSIQYLMPSEESMRGITRYDFMKLKNEFPDKLFIIVSHVNDKGYPIGAVAVDIEYDADIKLDVEGFRAFCKSRLGGGTPFTIWQKGAQEYWGNN